MRHPLLHCTNASAQRPFALGRATHSEFAEDAMAPPVMSIEERVSTLIGQIDALGQLVLALAATSQCREALAELLTTGFGQVEGRADTVSDVDYARGFAAVRAELFRVLEARALAPNLSDASQRPTH